MRLFLAAVAVVVLLSGVGAGGDEKKSPARELKAKVKLSTDGKPTQPKRVNSVQKLESLITDGESRDAIQKEIDFAKESLVIFAWQGSGGDRISATGDEKEVKFVYVAGLTRDLRQHIKLFAVPKDAKHVVLKGGR